MHHRKDHYAQEMGLAPLSEEGGYFKETFRSPQTVSTPDREGGERKLFTTIYYMIQARNQDFMWGGASEAKADATT